MNWDIVRRGFLDELEKISEVNLSGLSPENVMAGSQPLPPMETAGFSKARDILGMAQQMKTAAPVGGAYGAGLPQSQTIMTPHSQDTSTERNVKSLGANVVGGMGVGKLLTDFAHGPVKDVSRRANWGGMAAGGALGLGNYALHKYRKAQEKKAEMTKLSFSPGQALKSTQQVARTAAKGIHSGPGLKSRTPLLGRRFT